MPAPAISAAPEQWGEVARHVRERRLQLGLSQEEVGASRSVVSNLENGKQDSYARSSLADVSRGLQWTADSIDRILAGDEPIPDDEHVAPSLVARVAAIEAELAEVWAKIRELRERVVDPTDLNPETMVPNWADPNEAGLWRHSKEYGGRRDHADIVFAVIAYRYAFDPETGDYEGVNDGLNTDQERGSLGVFISGTYAGSRDRLVSTLRRVRYSDIGQVSWPEAG